MTVKKKIHIKIFFKLDFKKLHFLLNLVFILLASTGSLVYNNFQAILFILYMLVYKLCIFYKHIFITLIVQRKKNCYNKSVNLRTQTVIIAVLFYAILYMIYKN